MVRITIEERANQAALNPIVLPLSQWPTWARAMRQLSTPDDKGVGDVIARIIGDEKSEAFKSWYLKVFGKPCGCSGRQEQWNKLYPIRNRKTQDSG